MKKLKFDLNPEDVRFFTLVAKKLSEMKDNLTADEKKKLLAIGLTEDEVKEIVDYGGKNIKYQ